MSPFQARLLDGAIKAAGRRGARVIGFQGSFLNRAEQRAFDGSFLYELAGPSAVDGLVVVSNILASVVGLETLRAFCSDVGVPVVSIGELPGFSCVCIDSQAALTTAISHLVTEHGRRKLAFIQGNPGNPESAERERAFRSALAALDVPIDERLIVPGTFLEGSGASAVRVMFEQRGLEQGEVDAIVAGNDQMAIGAARELRARGVRVPEEVAIVGFDNDDHARGNSPPLTTIAQPIERVGELAAGMLLDRLAGSSIPERITLRAEAVFRRSCGCDARGFSVPFDRAPAAVGPPLASDDLASAIGRRHAELVKTLPSVEPNSVNGGIDALRRLLSTEHELAAAQALNDFEHTVLDCYEQGLGPLHWEDLLAELSFVVRQFFASPGAIPAELESRLARARLLVHEVGARLYSLERLYEVQRANALRVLGSALACARGFPAIAKALDAGLPGLGVRYCSLYLFVDGSERSLSKAIVHYFSSARGELLQDAGDLWRTLPDSTPPNAPASDERASLFPTRQLFGGSRAPESNSLDLLLYPLVFAERALGYVVFDAPKQVERAWLLENIAGHLSGAVYALARADELREARALAERASAAKSEFVAMMSHEIRTPLTAIHGHLELCLRTALSREQESHLSRALTSSRSLLRIVNDILDFSKIEAQRLELVVEPFGLEELLEQLSGTFAAVANRKTIELVFDVHPDTPLFFEGDALRASQILLNLLGNALKFTDRGYVVLSVRKVDENSTHSTVEFAIKDTGPGIGAAELTRIFNPFTQADSSMTRRHGGTGLGLSISKRLIGIMGGAMDVASTLGRGSLFRFTLPLGTVQGANARVAESLASLASLRVLVVEACQPQAEALQRLLATHAEEVQVCATGSAGLAAFRSALSAGRAFNVVLVTRALPDMEGTALIARFRRALPPFDLTALILGPSDDEFWSNQSFRQAGASATIAKPFWTRTVLRAIARARAQDRGLRRSSVAVATTALLPSERSLQGWTVLVAQDDSVGLELTRSLLEQWGASVTAAKNGQEALEQARRKCFSLILLDLQMPELDGFEAARAIRAEDATAIIVALTASVREEDRARALAAGMDAYVRTPLESSTLLAKLLQAGSGVAGVGPAHKGPPAEDQVAPSSRGRSQTLLDTRGAIARVDGDQATYRRLLKRFLGTHADDVRTIKQAHAEGDQRAMVHAAHTLSSAAANIGAGQLQRAALGLEAMLRSDGVAAADWLNDVAVAHELTLGAAAAALSSLQAAVSPRVTASEAPVTLLKRARSLITNHDTAAVDCIQSLGESLGAHAQAREPLRRLEASVEIYDFEQARLDLDALSHALDIDR